MVKHPRQLGPIALRPGNLFLIDPLAAGRLQRGALLAQILIPGRNAGIAYQHSDAFRKTQSRNFNFCERLLRRLFP